jgi:SAM-dependent methyltransferase
LRGRDADWRRDTTEMAEAVRSAYALRSSCAWRGTARGRGRGRQRHAGEAGGGRFRAARPDRSLFELLATRDGPAAGAGAGEASTAAAAGREGVGGSVGDLTWPVRNYFGLWKRALYSRYLRPRTALLDLAHGQGADVAKFAYARISSLIAVDLVPEALDEAMFRAKHNRHFVQSVADTQYLVQDLSRVVCRISPPVDTVNCQFALHYMWGSDEARRTLLTTVRDSLKPRGHFLVTVVDAERIPEAGITDHPFLRLLPPRLLNSPATTPPRAPEKGADTRPEAKGGAKGADTRPEAKGGPAVLDAAGPAQGIQAGATGIRPEAQGIQPGAAAAVLAASGRAQTTEGPAASGPVGGSGMGAQGAMPAGLVAVPAGPVASLVPQERGGLVPSCAPAPPGGPSAADQAPAKQGITTATAAAGTGDAAANGRGAPATVVPAGRVAPPGPVAGAGTVVATVVATEAEAGERASPPWTRGSAGGCELGTWAYSFSFRGVVDDVDEFVVPRSQLLALCDEFGLDLVETSAFRDHWDTVRAYERSHPDLYPCHWRALDLYRSYVFQKRP